MPAVDVITHILIIGFLVTAISFMYGSGQAVISTILGIVAGIHSESVAVLYTVLFLSIPQILLAILIGWAIGYSLTND